MLTVRLCGERDFGRRRRLFPYTFFYHCWVAGIYVLVSVDASLVPLTWANVDDAVGRFEQMNLNAQAQSVCSWMVMPNCS